MDVPSLILKQIGTSQLEPRIASQFAMTTDTPIQSVSMEGLDHCLDELKGGAMPVGTVEFVRKAMSLAGMAEPDNFSYPDVLGKYLMRELRQQTAGEINGNWFVKPVTTKTFTGFVLDTANTENLGQHDREQFEVFLSLPQNTIVWVSEPVTWLSEFRYYVESGEVIGFGRYDGGPDDLPEPDLSAVKIMASEFFKTPGAPSAFSLDVGVLGTGKTALIECNDAWALGYYRGTLSHKDYIKMLWKRWSQLFNLRVNE